MKKKAIGHRRQNDRNHDPRIEGISVFNFDFRFFRQVSGDCRDYTFEDCNFANGPFETAKDLDDASICQQFCSLVYTEDCTFFVWDTINLICELYDYNMTEYLTSCKTLGGSPSPGLEACGEYVDKCMVNIICFLVCPW